MRLAVGCLLFALPALAQLDSAALRAKFGAPLNREMKVQAPSVGTSAGAAR
jgi:hypothetical protein